MTLSDLKHLLHYTRWANTKILEELLRESQPSEKAIKWLAHIFAAQHLWLDRMTEDPGNHLIWPEWGIYECEEQLKKLDKRWSSFFESLSDEGLQRQVSYVTSRNEKFTNTIGEILTHLILHAPHHRGQINAELRAEGQTPPQVDYIQAVRTKQL